MLGSLTPGGLKLEFSSENMKDVCSVSRQLSTSFRQANAILHCSDV